MAYSTSAPKPPPAAEKTTEEPKQGGGNGFLYGGLLGLAGLAGAAYFYQNDIQKVCNLLMLLPCTFFSSLFKNMLFTESEFT
jgi:hypothetical protein